MQSLLRYWYVALVLLLIVALQLGFGWVGVHAPETTYKPEPPGRALVSALPTLPGPIATHTRLPTLTSTPTELPPTATLHPINTPVPHPSATNTRVPTWTPTPTPEATATPTPIPMPTPSTPNGYAVTVPILMYHYLSAPPADADAIRRDLSVSPEQFEAQLAYLRAEGYQTISMAQLSYALAKNTPLPAKRVVITFDDGYRDQYEYAFPLLKKYGYTATFYVFTQVIDENNVNFLTWDMVTEMHRAGMEFGSHSYRHSDLTHRDVDFLVYEILGSKEAIEQRIGEPVTAFCYPSGRYDELAQKVVASANFWSAVTTEWGGDHTYTNRFEMPRVRIRGNDAVAGFAEKLAIAAE